MLVDDHLSQLLDLAPQGHDLGGFLWHVVLVDLQELVQMRLVRFLWLVGKHPRYLLGALEQQPPGPSLLGLRPHLLQVLEGLAEIPHPPVRVEELIQDCLNILHKLLVFIDYFHRLEEIGQGFLMASHPIVHLPQIQCRLKRIPLLQAPEILSLLEGVLEKALCEHELVGLKIEFPNFIVDLAKGFKVVALQVVESID